VTDVLQTPIETPLAGEPLPKPDISHTLTTEKETTAGRFEQRRERLAEGAIPVRDVKKLTRKRPENDGAVPIDFKEDAEADGSLTLRKAGKAYAKLHNVERGHELAKELGYERVTDDYAEAMSEHVTALGRSASEPKKVQLGLVDDQGALLTPNDGRSIRKHLKETGERELSPEEATKFLTNYRAAAAEADAKLKAEIQASVQAEQAEAQARAAAPVRQDVQPQQPQPQQQPQQASQVDPQVQQQRQLAAAYAEHAKLSAEERRAAEAVQSFDQWAASIPELSDNHLWAQLVRRAQAGDIQASKRIEQFQQARQNRDKWAAHFQQSNQNRVTRELQLQAHYQQQQDQQVRAFVASENKKTDAWIAQHMPQFATPEGKRQLREATHQYLRDELGMSDEDIRNDWTLRRFGSQRTLAEAAAYRLAQRSMRSIQRGSLPPVQRPGVAQARGVGDADQLRRLERELSNTKGERAQLQIAAKIQKLKRQIRGGD
jgi:hypothetical protein